MFHKLILLTCLAVWAHLSFQLQLQLNLYIILNLCFQSCPWQCDGPWPWTAEAIVDTVQQLHQTGSGQLYSGRPGHSGTDRTLPTSGVTSHGNVLLWFGVDSSTVVSPVTRSLTELFLQVESLVMVMYWFGLESLVMVTYCFGLEWTALQ